MCEKKCDGCQSHEPQWKEDFPIEWEKDHYVTRREMVKFLTLGSAFLVASNAVMAAIGKFSRPEQMPRKMIALASAIPENSSVLFRYPTEEHPCILVHTSSGEFLGYSQVCTHLSCAVVHRPEENTLFCPCHHGYFDPRTGRPTAGPPIRPLPRILLAREGDVIFATGVEV